ncbi:uncharacterized protein PAN0_001c0301 [Moesziomyces antarcticus]|uniref:Uncharacterized protein n=1 Tax=Pseudozyma antarctica TaxID=84753 RepID=A0A5C3FG23_PSEA2|nr:uncharacterized protein PAN0_001c0301 [Moesziomyces antarcticus]GAK62104.1 hypothetical protein PAN0_001c0301 [Moesziomyces antarcticus]SPO42635.1 uncharacterized protein PSANT_00318 [Moesziomyces antarcticus]
MDADGEFRTSFTSNLMLVPEWYAGSARFRKPPPSAKARGDMERCFRALKSATGGKSPFWGRGGSPFPYLDDCQPGRLRSQSKQSGDGFDKDRAAGNDLPGWPDRSEGRSSGTVIGYAVRHHCQGNGYAEGTTRAAHSESSAKPGSAALRSL